MLQRSKVQNKERKQLRNALLYDSNKQMKNFNPQLIPDRYRGLEGLVNWCKDSLQANDCDSAMWMLNGLYDRYEHNIEQKLWVAWLYGNCYWAPTAWVIWNEFPDQDLVNPERLEQWHAKHWRTLRYQTDCKWSKGHLPAMYESYHAWLDGRLQSEAIKDDFDYMWNEATKNWFKFGRYATWFYLQTLNETCGYEIDTPNLCFADHNGSRSHRNGLVIATGDYSSIDIRLPSSGVDRLESIGAEIRQEVGCSNWQLETMLCSYKKLARERDSRYIGYYVDRQASEIKKTASDGWTGVDWTPWWKVRSDLGIIEKQEKQTSLF